MLPLIIVPDAAEGCDDLLAFDKDILVLLGFPPRKPKRGYLLFPPPFKPLCLLVYELEPLDMLPLIAVPEVFVIDDDPLLPEAIKFLDDEPLLPEAPASVFEAEISSTLVFI